MLESVKVKVKSLSGVRLFVTPWTAAHQAPQSMGFSRQEYWSGLPFPSPTHESEVKVKTLSPIRLLATPWTAAYQTPPSMGFSRQEYWSGLTNYDQDFRHYFFGKNPQSNFLENISLNVC